ncbi:MAG TPA: oligopeptide/dipeptide ABC transporter ATP-binding protein [Thermoplasmata archaeon]|nr:oligopeptide/dipeptide ABC transporter ATP-binding protein [Thermoplasmata archaeon]
MTAVPPLLKVEGLVKHFRLPRSPTEFFRGRPARGIHAVDDVSFEIAPGETLGLIGESGSGKSTLGWLVARLHDPTRGSIAFDGREIVGLSGEALRRFRRNIQIVFQDPVGSLDPRMRVWQIVGEPIQAQRRIARSALRRTVAELLPTVGLPPDCLDQYPHEFSGGGRQRLSLARALSVEPRLVVLDEPTSALDVAVQAQILNRLVTLQAERGHAYLLITHNVAAVRYVADRVAVMYLGQVVEIGPVRPVLEHPAHPYTKALLAAVPLPDPSRRRTRYRISGEVPTMIDPPAGCRFAARCPFVVARCRTEDPVLRPIPGRPEGQAACHRLEEVASIAPEELLAAGGPPGAPGGGPA